MESLFLSVLRMSLAGGVVILAALLLRLALRSAPKKYSYFLWVAAAFRLCAPAGLTAPFSLFRLLSRPVTAGVARVPFELRFGVEAVIPDPAGVAHPAAPALAGAEAAASASFPWLRLLAWVWLAGVAAMLLYSLLTGLRLRLRLRTAIRQEEGVWRASGIASPFLLGFPRPRIYLPWGLEGADEESVLAHERAHIRRGDPWWRFLGWTLLCLHWFNPLCWLAFFLMGRDMELSCAEAVLARREELRESYVRSLVRIAARPAPRSPAPLAFGEIGVRQRVMNLLRRSRPRLWARAAASALCAVFFLAAVTDAQALALPARNLTVNGDGTFGALRWGMTMEEALAACPELTVLEEETRYGDGAILYSLPETRFQGYEAEVTVCFARFRLVSGNIVTDAEGIPLLLSYEIVIPGSAELTEALEGVLGEREKHQRDLSGRQAVVWVDSSPKPPYEERELPREDWYWHSEETLSDLASAEALRLTLPAWPELTDREVLEALCYTYGWYASVEERRFSVGTDTAFTASGKGYACQRLLSLWEQGGAEP